MNVGADTVAAPGRPLIPSPLRPTDRVAIVSPSGWVEPAYVEGAARWFRERGYEPAVAPHALCRFGTYSANAPVRCADLRDALLDPSVRAVFCSRGGYGAVHLLEELDRLPLRSDPKWLIGYSDISALHALMGRHGVASIHSPMARHLAGCCDGAADRDPASAALEAILRGEFRPVDLGSSPLSRSGVARGRLTGGNLAIIGSLLSTPFDLTAPGTILFIEDVGEPAYRIERMLWQLRLAGKLGSLAGLIVGSFTGDTRPLNGLEAAEVVREMVSCYDYPVAFGAPIGHTLRNIPLIENVDAELEVDRSGRATLRYIAAAAAAKPSE